MIEIDLGSDLSKDSPLHLKKFHFGGWSLIVLQALTVMNIHLKNADIRDVSEEEKKKQVQKRKSLPKISLYFLARFCSVDTRWSFQVAPKLACSNSRLQRNYVLLKADSFTCISTVSVYNASTKLEKGHQLIRLLVGE